MIPLGSCTMKLNSAAELEPMSYPGFANLHPFVPAADARGTRQMIDELAGWLVEITGYDRVSLQPNSGAQGEFAGLVAIRRYHAGRGESQRRVCLIPSSAHGTNAASAALAGLKVVVVDAAEDGSIDMTDLRDKVEANADQLAAIMMTYPSTHGVFEDTVVEACELVHAAGGYVDGANMNALVGLARPGRFGADVSHLNLHKTFAIPHGGGGPASGRSRSRSTSPATCPTTRWWTWAATRAGRYGCRRPVRLARGAADQLRLHRAARADGLRQASRVALLNANYIARRLDEHFPVLYTGQAGLVAHECIIDPRAICKQSGLSIDDLAKRLIDYGFHAPTMSFPVAGTLMIEPTESEDLAELDRFCDAMISIRGEIDRIISGDDWTAQDNPLVNAPHTLARVTADEWTHPYSRQEAAFPAGLGRGQVGGGGGDKYWPAVARVDNVYGDRHLSCSLTPVRG